ncbi:nucleoside 2-deoxyribosyltransferase [Xanthomonas campestris]|uniref:PfkB family carbohydrate kinase n=1 Tax=Xanthomonas campestris TaxID=339 RepID=UPI000E729104|nr:PfkB family carbohydrate kinase [Xanthomonas campestris]RJU09688.1 nucleoside 2-deoxyribosyltransferase [Xanthomonas campestris]
MLTIIGGIYWEKCLRPRWDNVYGSAGRAASAIARLGGQVELQGYLDSELERIMKTRSIEEGFSLLTTALPRSAIFSYTYGLAVPQYYQPERQPNLKVKSEKVLRFGMIEGTAVVDAEYVVFDPQNVGAPENFTDNGSKARHLALVLNSYEASQMLGERGLRAEEIIRRLAEEQGAEVVVLKQGPKGALVCHEGEYHRISAFLTNHVWKIGSGDQFAANFAYAWMEEKRHPFDAAERASKATAYYAEHCDFPTAKALDEYTPLALTVSDRYLAGRAPTVYLAGPFFTLGEIWVIEQARNCLIDMGLNVFSPYHDVGPGPAEQVVNQDILGIHESDLVLAIGDGLDSGTIFEIGYARARQMPVVFYAENVSQEDRKMMQGTDCFLSDDFVSAIYRTVWVAINL